MMRRARASHVWCRAVIEGMGLVRQIELVGSGDGKPKQAVHIADSGEIMGAASAST